METPEEQEEEEEEEGADKLVAVEGDAERDEGRTEVSEEALPTGTEEVVQSGYSAISRSERCSSRGASSCASSAGSS